MVRRSAAGLAGAHQATDPVCRKFTLPKATRLVLVGQVVDRHGRSVGDMRAMPGRDPIRPTHYGAYKASYFDGYGLGGEIPPDLRPRRRRSRTEWVAEVGRDFTVQRCLLKFGASVARSQVGSIRSSPGISHTLITQGLQLKEIRLSGSKRSWPGY